MTKTRINNFYRHIALFLVLMPAGNCLFSGEVPSSNVILSVGLCRINMQAANDSAIQGLQFNSPGLYFKLSGEAYKNRKNFMHVDLNMSFNNGTIDNGTVKESRLCFNYGFGRTYEYFKLSVSPGLCYSAIGYQNNLMNKSYTESRFAPSLGIQADVILLRSHYRYLALFIEGSAMVAKPSRWVQQLSVGVNWKPSFKKEERETYHPN